MKKSVFTKSSVDSAIYDQM